MTEEQWIGLLILAVGVYFIVCSVWGRGFFLYRLKIQRAAILFGEKFAHGFYFLLGVILAVAGAMKALGYY